jgi:hypothetical protein
MIPILLAALALALAAWLLWDVVTDCNQDCGQGRQCTCGKRPTETQGPT